LTDRHETIIICLPGWSDDRGMSFISRKVRTSKSKVPGNTRSGDSCMEDLLDRATEIDCLDGDGEKVV